MGWDGESQRRRLEEMDGTEYKARQGEAVRTAGTPDSPSGLGRLPKPRLRCIRGAIYCAG